ncbi:hypothetical protein QYE76_032594 [Lolium multiflorum]|uniref:GH3 middle domain-containing protein n=1 Tax=Lolium multiflorum TaxID=4521 RepID=A0AAD8QVF3_LOLMU|nr:hypothetical protein QYE76_032594 [Lolium multiflorum]
MTLNRALILNESVSACFYLGADKVDVHRAKVGGDGRVGDVDVEVDANEPDAIKARSRRCCRRRHGYPDADDRTWHGRSDMARSDLSWGGEARREYKLVIITDAGLNRYHVRDILRVTGFHKTTAWLLSIDSMSDKIDKIDEAELDCVVERASMNQWMNHIRSYHTASITSQVAVPSSACPSRV